MSSDRDTTSTGRLLVERYKCKMCRNFVLEGYCPYEVKCMFAHGEHELRTKSMNIRDGLCTEEAIRAHQLSLVSGWYDENTCYVENDDGVDDCMWVPCACDECMEYADCTCDECVTYRSAFVTPSQTSGSSVGDESKSEEDSTSSRRLVERYKCKMCHNFVLEGYCRYGIKCMFAHGEHELRTKSMNIRDGLCTEEAIQAFQKTLYRSSSASQESLPSRSGLSLWQQCEVKEHV